MKGKLKAKIACTNMLIEWAIENPLEEYWDYFGSSWPIIMKFEKRIRISPQGRVVTVHWLDGYERREFVQRFYTSREGDVVELEYILRGIIRSIKRVQKENPNLVALEIKE